MTIVAEDLETETSPDDQTDNVRTQDKLSDETPPERTDDENYQGHQPSADISGMTVEAQRIIEEARAKLDVLSQGYFSMGTLPGPLAAGTVLTAGELANAQQALVESENPGNGGDQNDKDLSSGDRMLRKATTKLGILRRMKGARPA